MSVTNASTAITLLVVHPALTAAFALQQAPTTWLDIARDLVGIVVPLATIIVVWKTRQKVEKVSNAVAAVDATAARVETNTDGKLTAMHLELEAIRNDRELLYGEVRRLQGDPEAGTTPPTPTESAPSVTIAEDGTGKVTVTPPTEYDPTTQLAEALLKKEPPAPPTTYDRDA